MTPRYFQRRSIQANPWSLVLACGVVLLGATVASAETGSSFELRPGLVIDPASGTAFLMQPTGGVEAFDLAQGSPRWSTTDAARPLVAIDGRLVAQVERRAPGDLGLVVFDAGSGRVQLDREVTLPEGVIPGVVEGLGVSFVARGIDRDGGAEVSWSYTRKPVGAIPDEMRRAVKAESVSGGLWLDPVSGALEARASRKAAPAAILLEGAERLDGVDARQFRSADGRHVLASEKIADGRTWNRYRWTIFTADGERLGTFEAPVSYAAFAVVDGQLLYEAGATLRRIDGEMVEQPLRLVAVSLPGGVVQWTRELRETAYRGPFPP